MNLFVRNGNHEADRDRSVYRKRSVTVKSAGGKGHFILRGGQSLARNEVCTGPHICKEEELDSKREQ